MKITTRLLFIAALLALALPFVFAGNAMAGYTGDGALHNAASTGWQIPPVTPGVNGCLADSTKPGRPDCNTVRFPAYTTAAACSASPEFVAGQAEWASVCTAADGTPINMSGVSRTALECNKLGGVYAQKCDGKWTDVPALGADPAAYQCLRCHNNTYQRNSPSYRWKTSTLKHGHKNMLRKVTAGQPWEGPDGLVYDVHSAGSGTTIDWTNATVTTTSMTPATRALYYIYGDWMAPAPSLVYDNSVGGAGTSAKYTCASCHTTGYVTTSFMAGKEPKNTYPALAGGITGSWDVDGIVCSRCHNVAAEGTAFSDPYRASLAWGSDTTSFTTHETDNFGVPYATDGALMTALCIECHNSTQTKADPAGQLKTNAAGNGFSGHILGNQFLNSVHGQYTGGSSAGVGTAANYASAFGAGRCLIFKTGVTSTAGQFVEAASEAVCADLKTSYAANSYTWTPDYYGGSCSTCHDVHQSIVPEVGADEPLRRECMHCHDKSTGTTSHPTGGLTPAGIAGGDNSVACEVCHMATESIEGSTHLPVHLWRINTDASYRTFPTAAQWSAGTKIANTAPDGTYTNAVWVDLDLACGQCHGGSGAAKPGIVKLTKEQLSALATNIHGSVPKTASFTWALGASNNVVDFTVTSGCANGPCVNTFNYGDGTSGTALSHTYAAPGNYLAVLTVTDALLNTTSSPIVSVAAVSTNTAPNASKSAPVLTGMTVSVTDTSTDAEDAQGALAVTVNCGNGTIATAAGGGTAVCTYTSTGLYTIRHSVKDTGGLGSLSAPVQVNVNATKYRVSGTITKQDGTPIPYATLKLKLGGVIKYSGTSSSTGTFAFGAVLPGSYTVTATKTGLTFADPAATVDVVAAPVAGVVVKSNE